MSYSSSCETTGIINYAEIIYYRLFIIVLVIPCFAIKYTSNLIISNGYWNSVYAIILQYRPCANVISVCHLESVNQPEKLQIQEDD